LISRTGSKSKETTTTPSSINDYYELKKTIDTILADAKRRKKKKKIQMEQPLFEASTVILAQYLQAGMVVRTKVLWDLSASSQRSNVAQS